MRFVWVIILISIILTPSIIYSSAQESQELSDNLEPIEVTIPINIQLWGFNDGFDTLLLEYLPTSLIQNAYYPNDNEYDQMQLVMDGTSFGLINNLDISLSSVSEDQFGNVTNELSQVNSGTIKINPQNPSDFYTGRAITPTLLYDLFDSYASDDIYTIHLMNFKELDNEGENYHWFDMRDTLNITPSLDEMRNVYNLRNQQILFDVSALAPFFGYDTTYLNKSISERIDSIGYDVKKIIEQVIVGIPQSNWYTPIETNFHVARILMTFDTSQGEYIRATNQGAYDNLKNEIRRVLGEFDLVQSYKNVDIRDVPKLHRYINSSTIDQNGSSVVIVDGDFAEKVKDEIRNNYYNDYPSRYYIGLFMILDEDRNYYLETPDGYNEYSIGQIGFALDDLDEYYQVSISNIGASRVSYHSLRLFGNSFGLPFLNESITMQIDSAMSSYGVTYLWNQTLTPEEVDIIQRRYSVSLRAKLQYNIEKQLDRLGKSLFFWIDTSRMEKILSDLQKGEELENKLNYEGALDLYINMTHTYEDEIELIQKNKNFVNYGLVLLAGLILLGYYSKILNDESISKDEFRQQIKKWRKYNMRKNKID